MTRLIALFAMFFLLGLNQVFNMYYTYGIWPKSFGMFILFFLTSTILWAIAQAIGSEED